MNEKQARAYPLRLDHELYKWVQERAKDGDRSINAELVRIVRQAKESEQKQTSA
jgi:hypothetical protein